MHHCLPMGLLELGTIGFFSTILFLVGYLGTAQLAAHAVTIQLAEIAIGFAFGFSEAAAVVIASHSARHDTRALRQAIRQALIWGSGVMVGFALVLVLFRQTLIGAFVETNQPLAKAVADTANGLFVIAAACLIADSGRIVLIGVLRGLSITKGPLLVFLCLFWLIGLPLSAALAFKTNLGVSGVWVGMGVAMALVSVALFLRLRRFHKQHLDLA